MSMHGQFLVTTQKSSIIECRDNAEERDVKRERDKSQSDVSDAPDLGE